MAPGMLGLLLGAVALVPSARAAGFPNEWQTPGELLSGLNAPNQGRLAIIAFHNGILFTVPEVPSSQPGSDFLVRTWDINDPRQPVELASWGVTPMPINAHGYFKSGDYLVLGSNWPPEAPWSFRATELFEFERTTFPELNCAGVRGCLFGPWFVGDTYWSYGEVEGDAFIELDGQRLSTWDHLGTTGVIGHPFLLGDRLIFAADQSRTGVASYDIADPENPVLLDVLTDGGPGGYWPELWAGDGRLLAVFPYRTNGNGIRVVDVTEPADLRFVADVPLPGASAMYIQFQDEYAFVGDHKVDMRTFESVLFLDGANATRTSDGGTGVDTSQFALPVGNLLVTGGSGPDQGMAIWAHQAAPDTRGPEVGFHVPEAGRTGYPVGAPISLIIHETLETTTLVNGETFIVRPVGGSPIAGRLSWAFDDVLTFAPDLPLLPDTTYEVVLPEGGIQDVAGNGMVGYSFSFSTGAVVGGNQVPSVTSFTATPYPAAPAESVTLSASATDADGDELEYRFELGDGSPKTAWSSDQAIVVSYAQNGHYRTNVQVRDPSGAIATTSRTVTVVEPQVGASPRASSSIACDVPERRAWVANPDNDSVAAMSLDSLARDLETPVCADPRSVAKSLTGEVWVSCHDDDRLGVLNSSSGAPVALIETGYGSAPQAVLASPDGATIYVSFSGTGEVRAYDAATRSLVGSVVVGPTARALAISGDGSRLFVTRFVSPKDWAEVWEVDAEALTVVRTFEIPKFGGDENRDTTAAGRGVANYLTAIVIAPDGETAWVAANKPNTERGLLIADDLDQDNTVRNIIFRLDLVANRFLDAIDIDNSDSASALAFSPLGDYLFVTLQGDGEVVVFDALAFDDSSGLGSMVTRLGAGLAPQGVCSDEETGRTFIKSFLSRSVTTLETDELFRSGSIAVPSSSTSTVVSERLSAQELAGKRIFYDAGDPRMSAEGYISCATCHLDGSHDGRVWDFTGRGEGLRNTITLRGRSGMANGNVHWTGNFDEIQDFEGDIRNAFGGSGFLQEEDWLATSDPLGAQKEGLSQDLDALAAYVSSLGRLDVPRSPFRTASGGLTPQAQAGIGHFVSLGCNLCHGTAALTDSTQGSATLHDVGTARTTSGTRLGELLEGLDTPTLHGLWNTAPYFHDGSAATLLDVFTVAGGEVIPAETGLLSGGASLSGLYVDLNNDDTVRGRAFVDLGTDGARLTLEGVDGGSGGSGAVELRYSVGFTDEVEVLVNQTLHLLSLPDVGNDPNWRHTNWGVARLEDVVLSAGATNTVEVVTRGNYPDVSVDEITVSTADDRAAAEPHRSALALSPSELEELEALLLQLDGRAGS